MSCVLTPLCCVFCVSSVSSLLCFLKSRWHLGNQHGTTRMLLRWRLSLSKSPIKSPKIYWVSVSGVLFLVSCFVCFVTAVICLVLFIRCVGQWENNSHYAEQNRSFNQNGPSLRVRLRGQRKNAVRMWL